METKPKCDCDATIFESGFAYRPDFPEDADLRIELCSLHAAAPDLLEALKKWEFWYSGDSTEFNRDTARESGLCAIAKAEGRQA